MTSAKSNSAVLFQRAQALLFSRHASEASRLFEEAVAMEPNVAEYHLWLARSYAAEAKESANALRLLAIGWRAGDELEAAVRLAPDRLDARLDLLRYYVVAPRLVGGSNAKADEEAASIAQRDAALGAFAHGYIAYRRKEYAPARARLEEAVRLAKSRDTKVLALTWLGYLSQETQRYDDAFAAFEEIVRIDPSHTAALYEIGRTAVFSGRDRARGEAALEQYLKVTPAWDAPTWDEAREQLRRLK